MRTDQAMEGFENLWAELFASPVHLDSALSKRNPGMKTLLAQLVPVLLRQPASTAEALGIGVPEGEPWTLEPEERSRWRPARLTAERLHGRMSSGLISCEPSEADFPPAMVAEWREAFGAETVARLVTALGAEPPLTLRASRRLGAEKLLAELRKAGVPVKATLSAISPLGVRLAGYAPVLGLPAHERGDFEIQDEGSQAMAAFSLWPEAFAKLLAARPGDEPEARSAPAVGEPPGGWTVVDACAGAGGKTLALADLLAGKGRVYSYDTSARKLEALRRRAKRAGITNVQTVAVEEGRESDVVSKFRRRAQVVLVDAPCSGWGVLKRNPDIKWRQDAGALERMPAIQSRILAEYSGLVAPGGRLVYGVCTFRPAETSAIVDGFLAAHPDFKRGPGGYLGPGASDGFFMQSFEQTSKAGP